MKNQVVNNIFIKLLFSNLHKVFLLKRDSQCINKEETIMKKALKRPKPLKNKTFIKAKRPKLLPINVEIVCNMIFFIAVGMTLSMFLPFEFYKKVFPNLQKKPPGECFLINCDINMTDHLKKTLAYFLDGFLWLFTTWQGFFHFLLCLFLGTVFVELLKKLK